MEKLTLNGFYFGFEGTGTATVVITNSEYLNDEILELVAENEYDVASGTWAFEELKAQLQQDSCRVAITNSYISATPVLSMMGIRSSVEIEGVDVPFKVLLTPREFDSRVRVLYYEQDYEFSDEEFEMAS